MFILNEIIDFFLAFYVIFYWKSHEFQSENAGLKNSRHFYANSSTTSVLSVIRMVFSFYCLWFYREKLKLYLTWSNLCNWIWWDATVAFNETPWPKTENFHFRFWLWNMENRNFFFLFDSQWIVESRHTMHFRCFTICMSASN